MGWVAGDSLWSVAVFTAIFLLLVDLMHQRKFWTSHYPPGPLPVPALGNLLQVDFQNMPYSLYKVRVTVPLGASSGPEGTRWTWSWLPGGGHCKVWERSVLSMAKVWGVRARRWDRMWRTICILILQSLEEDTSFIAEVLNAVPMLLRISAVPGKAFPKQKAFVDMLDKLLTEHKMTWDPAQPPRHLTDAFVAEVKKAKGNPESSFNDENLHMVVLDLFSAGMVTTSTTLTWALLLMILYPDVQRRVQEEIDEVLGQARTPVMEDQARMPFTTAVIHEVQRFGDIAPLNLPHMTSRDIEVQGFVIPKGTTLITNLSSVLKDESAWEKPLQFHPEHFLDAQGRFLKPEAFIPFGAGRRACLGEPLARMELFLFFTCLLQRFTFSVPPGQPPPSALGNFALPVVPKPYELCAVPR
uniref:Cytochrome P450, family 2, subfamily d, polypeptide 26 n=2 Tax=Nannospalax galili TaxID=1026970 RepID=A0A8C6RMF1_NANGA